MKGTPSMGQKAGNKNMIHCRRCGGRTYHIHHKTCSSCGYGRSAKLRDYKWLKK
jgi:large subunit ribosomal protein L37e